MSDRDQIIEAVTRAASPEAAAAFDRWLAQVEREAHSVREWEFDDVEPRVARDGHIPTIEEIMLEATRTTGFSMTQVYRGVTAHDAEVAATAIESLAADDDTGVSWLNLHRDIPNHWEGDPRMYGLCEDDECLFWEMTYHLGKRLQKRAKKLRKLAKRIREEGA